MRPDQKPAITLLDTPDQPDLILGAGGSRAVLACTGFLMASQLAGRTRWRTISGVSGGSIPALMLAAGVPIKEIVHNVIEVDFVSQLTPRVSLVKVWWAFFVKNCLWKRRHGRGVLDSEKLGKFVEKFAPTWPANYWTVAVSGSRSFLFTADGVYELKPKGQLVMISDRPAPVGLAIRATCAVPGIIDGVDFDGELLLDGALTGEPCPTRIAKQYVNAKPGAIVACDVGEEDATAASREHIFWRVLRQLVCGDCCEPVPFEPTDSEGVLLVQPPAAAIQTLDLKLSDDQKWQVIMSGFTSTVARFSERSLISGAKLDLVNEVVSSYAQIEREPKRPGELAARTQELVARFGLY
jgi:predicted acylesterase/phospholipase RssA